MGTKRLARTIIEGGRARRNVFERRHSNGQARAGVHAFERALGADAERWEDDAAPERTVVHVWQHDKLGAPRRWLRAQRGRRWDDIYAEIRARFDTRTIPGHHIVFDHLLREVDFGHEGRWHWSRGGLFVDDAGRLQQRAPRNPGWRRPRLVEPPARLLAWLGERRVGRRGGVWFWFVPVGEARPDEPRRYRQDVRLDPAETRRWECFFEPERRALTLVFDSAGRPVTAAAHLR